MAVSNNDRVSSSRLRDALRKLQDVRHLGKEPEVTSQSYAKVTVPSVGSHSQAEFLDAFTAPNDAQLPFRVYHTAMDLSTDPIVISEPTGNYTEVTKSAVINNINAYVEESFTEVTGYTGYAVMQQADDMWFGVHYTNGVLDAEGTSIFGFVLYPWVMPAKTVTTTTKYPIAQKYLPNADWNQNDPDGDGYVEGRPFYTETVEGQEVVHELPRKYVSKPNYLAPNIDDQIGIGYGYNDMVGNYYNQPTIYWQSFATTIGSVTATAPFKGNITIGKQLQYMYKLYPTTNAGKEAFAIDFYKAMEGKMIGFADNMYNDPGFTDIPTFCSNPDNYKSVYDARNKCLTSPIIKIGDNNYQTRLIQSGTNAYFKIQVSVNNESFVDASFATGSHTGICWMCSYNTLPLDIGSCDVENESIVTDKLANGAVTYTKMDSSVSQGVTMPNSVYNISTYSDQSATTKLDTIIIYSYKNSTKTTFFTTEGSYDTLMNQHYDYRGNLTSIITANSSTNTLELSGLGIQASSNKTKILCLLVVTKNGQAPKPFFAFFSCTASTATFQVFDSSFFQYFTDNDDILFIQTIHNPTH